jgi:hypothetical protein
MIRQRKTSVGGCNVVIADSTLSDRFTHEELKAAFERVEDSSDWKQAIDALVPASKREVTAAAIEYFTGTEASFWELRAQYSTGERLLHVKAPGYYAGQAGHVRYTHKGPA